MVTSEKFQALSEAILDGDEDLALEETDKLLADGVKPIDIFTDCVEPTLNHLGDQFSRLEVFLPNLIIAGDVVKEMQDKLLPIMEAEQSETSTKGTGVICTVYGDLHDIGKNMVALMLQINGYDVIDLGEDVPPLTVVKKAEEIKADLVCLSGLMLPSLPYMDETIQQGPREQHLEKYEGHGRRRFRHQRVGRKTRRRWLLRRRDGRSAPRRAAARQISASCV